MDLPERNTIALGFLGGEEVVIGVLTLAKLLTRPWPEFRMANVSLIRPFASAITVGEMTNLRT